MSLLCKWLNGCCLALYHREYKRFMADCDVRAVQERYLLTLLRKQADTVYGRAYGFSGIGSYAEYAERVPLTVYEDYAPYLEAAAEGKEKVLTAEPIQLFELTSGSSGGKKLIPYTAALKREFQCGIRPWLYDLYSHVEGLRAGKSYWSITPVTAGRSYTAAGIPIGFEEDAEYFGVLEQGIMRRLFAVDGSVKFVSDMDSFYLETVRQLLQCKELTLISVWNPTLLTILCDVISAHTAELADVLTQSQISAVKEQRFDRVFPQLKLISCWADGSAQDQIHGVIKRFPNVRIQPKGLLATECFVSFPLIGEEGSRLSLYSHFFEFRSLADDTIVTAERLQPGCEYEVIVTTGGGFYRYCLGDVITVLAAEPNRPPRIRFLRRRGICSDLYGEKLTEAFVQSVCRHLGITDYFCLLAPEGNRYCFYTDAPKVCSAQLDAALCESYHYQYCRQLGQLACAEVVRVCGQPQEGYLKRLMEEGIRIGDIKPTYLTRYSGWKQSFEISKERNNRTC